jgi:uncharacterized membrane protein
MIQKLKKSRVRNAMIICGVIALGPAMATPTLAAHGGGHVGGGFGGGHVAGGFGRGGGRMGGEFHGGGRRFGERFLGGGFEPGYYDYDGLDDYAGDGGCFQYRYVQTADGGQWRQVWVCN